MNIYQTIAKDLNIKESQVVKTVELIDEGNTIPFISRYRKEITGNLSDTILRELEARLSYLRNLSQRQEEVVRLIEEQGKLTEELKKQIESSETLSQVEDLYLPYRPKKRTRASAAREKGLEGLSTFILSKKAKEGEIEEMATKLSEEKEEISSPEEALQGAMDIIAENIAEDAFFRNILRRDAKRNGAITGEVLLDEESKYTMYHDFSEKLKDLKPHRILALNRGEKEGSLKVKIHLSDEENIKYIRFKILDNPGSPSFTYIDRAVRDSYKRLLFPSIETELRSELKAYADEQSIAVFAGNLKPYLMQSPIKDATVMGLDPGFRTGCKVAVISDIGKVLDYATIYPTAPHNKVEESVRKMKELIEKHGVTLIAIGNGTASRETEQIVATMLQGLDRKIYYSIVNESGASIYSASELGNKEFPDLDVTIRGAISIARRIQDPMAELVKIEPKHIGVGQYQHDVNQKELNERLSQVIEDCVNSVGVNINTASAALLGYVSGLTKTTSQNIVEHKETKGAFRTREEIKEVKGIGPKAFTQCAGFLRIPDSPNPLDNTGVHPESYGVAEKLIGRDLDQLDIPAEAKALDVGVLTLQDIVLELKKPGRDPREDMPTAVLRDDVLSIDDLVEGMELEGTVRNVVDFGCFVDIGIKNDGLVHISEMSDRFIKHPGDLVKVSDIVKVRIISIDRDRGKVGLSMKGMKSR